MASKASRVFGQRSHINSSKIEESFPAQLLEMSRLGLLERRHDAGTQSFLICAWPTFREWRPATTAAKAGGGSQQLARPQTPVQVSRRATLYCLCGSFTDAVHRCNETPVSRTQKGLAGSCAFLRFLYSNRLEGGLKHKQRTLKRAAPAVSLVAHRVR